MLCENTKYGRIYQTTIKSFFNIIHQITLKNSAVIFLQYFDNQIFKKSNPDSYSPDYQRVKNFMFCILEKMTELLIKKMLIFNIFAKNRIYYENVYETIFVDNDYFILYDSVGAKFSGCVFK